MKDYQMASYLFVDCVRGEKYQKLLADNYHPIGWHHIDEDDRSELWRRFYPGADWAADVYANEQLMVMPDEIQELLDDPIAASKRVNSLLRDIWFQGVFEGILIYAQAVVGEAA